MTVADTIRNKLTKALTPASIEVVDESAKHAGHAGARPEGETHFQVTVIAEAFEGKSRIDRQRMVYDILSQELATRVHALTLVTRAPGEG